MDPELRELHRGAREERKRLAGDPEPCEPFDHPKDGDDSDLPEAPDEPMECPDCGWEGEDSQVKYVGFRSGSRYTWKQVHRLNITVEALTCPRCDSFEVRPPDGWL